MKFRKARSRATRPVLQYTGKNMKEVDVFLYQFGINISHKRNSNGSLSIKIPNDVGNFVAYPGDWLINENGGFSMLDEGYFKARYILC